MKGNQKDRSECTKEEEKRQTFVRFEVRSLHCGVTSFRSSLPRVLFPHLTRPPFGNSFSRSATRDCNAVHQGSAVPMERVQRSAHRKLLRCIAMRAGDEEGEWRER